MAREALGEFEHLVLLAILRLGEEAYGVPIAREIEGRTDREVSRAAVYIALRRLEKRGLVSSRLGAATPERGGRPKRFSRLEGAGLAQLQVSRRALMRMWEGHERVLEPAMEDA